MLAAAVAGVGFRLAARSQAIDLPAVRYLDIKALVLDDTPVDIVTTVNWHKVPRTVTADEVASDPTTWVRIHLEDWDRLPYTLRTRGLTNMVEHFRAWIDNPADWHHLRAPDWDRVPQPVRALAFLAMVEAWSDRYRLGESHGLDRRLVTDTAKAIAMTESWFDHRAVHVNRDGSRDVGISGASAYARQALARLHRRGLADFTLSEDDYFEPLQATRVLVFWFARMLTEANGDLDLAIRAYNVGIGRARRGAGAAYLRMVQRRRSVYVWCEGETPSWSHLLAQLGPRQGLPAEPVTSGPLDASTDVLALELVDGLPEAPSQPVVLAMPLP